MKDLPRITFGMIVLNGRPFVRYNLRALYPFAHEIIVVEGATPGAASVATPDGHSTDGTLETLYRFKAEEDPENKVQIVVRDGFWSEKDEESQAYAQRATGDYLWQVDIDEFYHPRDIQAVLNMLQNDPSISAIAFREIKFWGGFDYIVDGWRSRRGSEIYHRLFKWGAGYRYVTHRPPTVYDPQGRDLRHLKWINGYELARRGIFLYHYSLVFPKQVIEKCEYYSDAAWARRLEAREWAQEVFLKLQNPYRVHNVYELPSWLERFVGDHSPQIEALRADLKAGRLDIVARPTDDIERLLQSPRYQLGRVALKSLEPWDRYWGTLSRRWRGRLLRLLTDPIGSLGAMRRKVSRFLDLQS
jgi:hypothetical protein